MAQKNQIDGLISRNEMDGFFVAQGSRNQISSMLQNESSEVLQFRVATDGKDGSCHIAPLSEWKREGAECAEDSAGSGSSDEPVS